MARTPTGGTRARPEVAGDALSQSIPHERSGLANTHARPTPQPDARPAGSTGHADPMSEQTQTHRAELSRWVTADVVAGHLHVDISYVYEHAAELGARRLGRGPRARLRFRLDLVDDALVPVTSADVPNTESARIRSSRRGRTRQKQVAVLLPIRRR
jgi:hypothetical protein